MKWCYRLLSAGIGFYCLYSSFSFSTVIVQAITLWYMSDGKGIQMLLVSQGNCAEIFSVVLLAMELFISPLYSLLMINVLNELYGFWEASFFFFSSTCINGIFFFIVGSWLCKSFERKDLQGISISFLPLMVTMVLGSFLMPGPMMGLCTSYVFALTNRSLQRVSF